MTISEDQKVECSTLPCKDVTVYADRAEVKRLLATELQAGTNTLTVFGLPESIYEDSVRVDGRGADVTICEVQYAERWVKLEDATLAEKQREQKRLIEEKQNEIRQAADQISVIESRAEVLKGVSKQVANGPSGPDDEIKRARTVDLNQDYLKSLEQFLDFAGDKMNKTATELRVMEEKHKNLKEELRILQRNAREHMEDGHMAREVTIVLECAAKCSVELDVSYLVSRASWTPTYDLRVFVNGTDKVHYSALIRQETGEDWTETNLHLSTATPALGGQVPELKTLRATFVSRQPPPQAPKMKSKMGLMKRSKQTASKALGLAFGGGTADGFQLEQECDSSLVSDALDLDEIEHGAMQVSESVINTTFDIVRATTIPSDNTSHKVNVTVIDFKPIFEHESVPCKSAHAFLKAKVTNTSDYPLLAGPASVFLDNSFVAKSSLKSVSPGEEFSCSLGTDSAVKIDYKPAKRFHEETGLLSKYSATVKEQDIEVKNTRKDKVTIRILEQIPLSTEEKMRIIVMRPEMHRSDTDKAPYKLNKDNILEWTLNLDPGQNETIQIKWAIEHPKSEVVKFEEM